MLVIANVVGDGKIFKHLAKKMGELEIKGRTIQSIVVLRSSKVITRLEISSCNTSMHIYIYKVKVGNRS